MLDSVVRALSQQHVGASESPFASLYADFATCSDMRLWHDTCVNAVCSTAADKQPLQSVMDVFLLRSFAVEDA